MAAHEKSSAGAVVVIGAGPAGLIAAEAIARAGLPVVVHDASASPARKFLLAGRGGLNLTHSEPLTTFIARYREAAGRLKPAIDAFPPEAVRAFAAELGEESFVGSSGRVFPKSFKATPLLRAWLKRLDSLGVRWRPRSRFVGFDGARALRFVSPAGAETVEPPAAVFALGGASWPRLGSDGGWVEPFRAAGITVADLKAANCGFRVEWSEVVRRRFAGAPLKTIELAHGEARVRGEAVVTAAGIEGGAVYALSAALRDVAETHGGATLAIDFRPDVEEGALAARLVGKAGASMATRLRKAGLSPVAAALMREAGPLPDDAASLARRAKRCEIRLVGTTPIARAISSAGGVAWDEIDADYMLIRRPGVFVAGEMIDWEAPTGGYLLQACFSTGAAAGRAGARFALGQASDLRKAQESP